ncbi:MAG TPA: putative Ig domain-containing protein, partial [Planctomycetota bacterium]|nr:putative Ig domain-containing protein [Planctomycetota bacterium]
KTGANDGFRVDARAGLTGALNWSLTTDYTLPPYSGVWTPSYPATLTPQNRLYFAGAGGTVYYVDNPDASNAAPTGQFAFYGMANYLADTSFYNSNVEICTPLTSDSSGNIYFGFVAASGGPLSLSSGIARIHPDGTGTYSSARATAGGDASITKPVYNCAPALSNDGTKLYIAVSNGTGFGFGRLVMLDAATLSYISSVQLIDPSGSQSYVPDDGTASPVVGPDGDVYFGVLENPFPGNNDRGWLMHFSSDLSAQKTTGAFGWDDTPSVVPASMVPSYTGTSTYLLATKYNNYASVGSGNGNNKLAILDPGASQVDPISGRTVMKEILTIAGVTPDPEYDTTYPNAVREWCINSAAVDPATGSIYAGSEDGKVYRWNLTTNSFTQVVTLTPGVGEAYTPTLIGPDGTVYAINNATLYAVGLSLAPAIQNGPPPNAYTVGVPYSFTYMGVGSPAPTYSVSSGALPDGLMLDPNSGALTGTPTTAGTFSGVVTLSNSAGSATQNFSITINPAISFGAPPSNGSVYTPYSQLISASGGTGAKTFAVSQGQLPDGLKLDSSAGTITGTPMAVGTFDFTIAVTDSVGASGQLVCAVSINPPPISIKPAPLLPATVASMYSVQFVASGGTAPYIFSVSGALPAGLTLTSGGLLSGTPTAGGSFTFSTSAVDSSGGTGPYSGAQSETLLVNAPTIAVTPAVMPSANVGTFYAQSLSANGGTAPYMFAVTSVALPDGLNLSASGTLTGTPLLEGTFTFTVTATDSSGGTGPFSTSVTYSILVDRVPEFLSGPTATPNPALVNFAVSFDATASFSDAIITWDFGDGSATVNGASAQNIYTADGTYTVTATAQNPRTLSSTSVTLTLPVTHARFVPGSIPMLAQQGTITLGAPDSISFIGYFQVAPSTPLAGWTLTFNLGGVTRSLTFDAKGRATTTGGSAALKLQRFKGSGGVAKLTLNINGAFKSALATGTTVDAQGNPTQILVTIECAGSTYSSVVMLAFKKTRKGFVAKF